MSAQTQFVMVHLLLPTVVAVMFVGSLVGIALGVCLIAATARTIGFMAGLNRWVSSRQALKPLETPRTVPWLTGRFRRWVAIAFIVAGAYLLVCTVSWPELGRIQTRLGLPVHSHSASAVLLETLYWIFALGSAVVLVSGLLLFFAPGVFSAIEARVDRWVSTRRIAQSADTMFLHLDKLVEAYPRAAGLTIAVTSLVAALGTAPLLVLIR